MLTLVPSDSAWILSSRLLRFPVIRTLASVAISDSNEDELHGDCAGAGEPTMRAL
jgi:hypothetical protein